MTDIGLMNMTSIVQSTDQIGDAAVNLILCLLMGEKVSRRRIVIDVRKKKGQTTK